MVAAGRTLKKQDAPILTLTHSEALADSFKQLAPAQALHMDAATSFKSLSQACDISSVEAIFIEVNGPSAVDDSLELVKNIRVTSHSANIFMLFTHHKSFSGTACFLAGADHCVKLAGNQAEKDDVLSLLLSDAYWKASIQLTLDRTRLHLHADGKKIDVSYTEMMILDALMNAPQHMMSQESIAKAVNPNITFYDPRALEKTISRLRTKIRTAYEVELIHSVRGFGYRLRRGIIS